jgi:hypothetical protein
MPAPCGRVRTGVAAGRARTYRLRLQFHGALIVADGRLVLVCNAERVGKVHQAIEEVRLLLHRELETRPGFVGPATAWARYRTGAHCDCPPLLLFACDSSSASDRLRSARSATHLASSGIQGGRVPAMTIVWNELKRNAKGRRTTNASRPIRTCMRGYLGPCPGRPARNATGSQSESL